MNIGNVSRGGLTLGIVAALCTAIVGLTWRLTAERIEGNRQAWLEQSLLPVLDGLSWDNNVIASRVTIATPHGLPGGGDARVYRAFAGDAPVAAVFVVTARDGYSGPIRLLVAVRADGVLNGVRILEHRETPGLGDGIDAHRSDWIRQFEGRSLRDPEPSAWKIRRDGGAFDQLTGASVTPRAVVRAVYETLAYFAANDAALFAAPADAGSRERML